MITEQAEDQDANSLGMVAWVTRVNWPNKWDGAVSLGIGILGHEVRVLGLGQQQAAVGSQGRGFFGGQEDQSGHFPIFDDQHHDPERTRTEGESQVILRAPVRHPPGACQDCSGGIWEGWEHKGWACVHCSLPLRLVWPGASHYNSIISEVCVNFLSQPRGTQDGLESFPATKYLRVKSTQKQKQHPHTLTHTHLLVLCWAHKWGISENNETANLQAVSWNQRSNQWVITKAE